jgi:hypothetical protein
MRRGTDWLSYLHTLAEQDRDLAHSNTIYGAQWAHDVRCIRQGVEHRRVGEVASHAHEEWLQAGYVARAIAPK